MSKPFTRGDRVFAARWQPAELREPCPVCFGQRLVTVILGDGTQVEHDCGFCGCGMTPPQGSIETWKREARVEPVTITEVIITDGPDGETREYRAGAYVFNDGDLWATEAAAMTEAVKRAAAKEQAEFERMLRRKNDRETVRTYSWAAGYHMREAKAAREKAEWHDKAARVCKERVRDKKDGDK